jgi:hypothetical protein
MRLLESAHLGAGPRWLGERERASSGRIQDEDARLSLADGNPVELQELTKKKNTKK